MINKVNILLLFTYFVKTIAKRPQVLFTRQCAGVTSLHFTIRTVTLTQSAFRASITTSMLSYCRFVASWTCLSPSPVCNPWKQLLFHFYNSIFQECYRMRSCNIWPFRIDFFLSTPHNFLKICPSSCMHWYSVLYCWILLHSTDMSIYLTIHLLKKIWPDFSFWL